MLKRGFKKWCESTAIACRKELNLDKTDPLSPHVLAQHLKVKLLNPNEITKIPQSAIKLLLEKDSSAWSAATISKGKSSIIIYNSSHAKTRQSNDIMHELSHIIIGHTYQKTFYSQESGILLRQYNKDQEDEADCLSATLLLPKDVLIKIKYSRISSASVARHYDVSRKLLEMRLNTSGVNKIYKRSGR